MTDAEILELTDWLKAHTLEDHGHFRTVEPLRVLEVAFNNIMRSDRHASGFALRFPRIVRIRDDKPLAEIDTLEARGRGLPVAAGQRCRMTRRFSTRIRSRSYVFGKSPLKPGRPDLIVAWMSPMMSALAWEAINSTSGCSAAKTRNIWSAKAWPIMSTLVKSKIT